jgi:ABC-2 type transport system permease protein
MNKIYTVIRKEYLERVRSKSFVIATLLGPAIMSLFILMPMLLSDTGKDEERKVGIVDPSGMWLDPLSEMLEQQQFGNIQLQVVGDPADGPDERVEEMKELILAGDLHSGVLVDPDFMKSRGVTFYNKSVSSLVVRDEVLRPAMNQILREARVRTAAVPDTLLAYLVARSSWSSIVLTDEGEQVQDDSVSIGMAFVLIMIIYIMVIMYGNHTLTAVIEEKSTRMVEVLLASISPEDLMLGKILGIGLAGLTQFGIWTGAFYVLSQRGIEVGGFSLDISFLTPVILISFIGFFVLGFFLYATMYAGIGAMCNTVQDSQQFHTTLAMGLVIPMMLLTMILRAPDSTLSVILSMVPLFSPILMFMRVSVSNPPLWQIGLSWGLMIVSIWFSARAAGKLFRVGILMHGAAPTWASLIKAIRA